MGRIPSAGCVAGLVCSALLKSHTLKRVRYSTFSRKSFRALRS